MRSMAALERALLVFALVLGLGVAYGAEAATGLAEDEGEKPGAGPLEGAPDDAVAKVDDVVITRADLAMVRRRLAMDPRRTLPNSEQLVEQLINEVLLRRYFRREGLSASGAEIQRAIQQLDADLRRRGTTYQRWIAAQGLTAEEHAGMISFELSKRRLVLRVQKDIPDEEVKTEFELHPEWYDGSRVRISQIFIRTSNIANEPEKLKKAKQRIDKLHADLKAGKEFDRLARDFSEGGASARGGDRGWVERKGPEADEDLRVAAWKLKVGETTAPMQGNQGWHILKVTDREPARLTYFGSKPNVIAELTRRRLKAILDELKAKANIQKYL